MNRLFLLLVYAVSAGALHAAALRVAAASSLSLPARELASAFEKATGQRVDVTLASSGTLFAQIAAGAPFTVFLSADQSYPERLEEAGYAEAGSRRLYARGRLGLWVSNAADLDEADSLEWILKSPALRRLAIANPRLAPYGVAAVQVLSSLGVDESLRGRIVQGENVTQTAHLARSGAADAALVALSLRQVPELNRAGRWVEVPDGLYEPVEHALAIVGSGDNQAHRFVSWLLGEGGRKVLARYGLDPAPGTVP